MSYRIFTDATADLTPELTAGLPEINILPMDIILDKQDFTYGPGGNISVEDFYRAQRSGEFASTSQIRPDVYLDRFDGCLRQGKDVLYLCFTSGMSATFQAACLCAGELQKQYPDRRIVCLDTLCASVGEGFLVLEAARQQAAGMDLDELTAWVEKSRLNVCHCSL